MSSINRAISLGYTCIKVNPGVGGCCRCDSAVTAIFSSKFTWKIKPFSGKLQVTLVLKAMWVSHADLASIVVK